MKATHFLSVAVLALSPALYAQTAHTPPTPEQMAQREVQRYTTLLSLNTSQVEQATTIFTTAATSAATIHTTEQTERQALEAAVKSGDASTLATAAAALGQTDGQMTLIRATAQMKFYQLLNADQQSKVAELEKEHMGGGRFHGGPGGPPPGM